MTKHQLLTFLLYLSIALIFQNKLSAQDEKSKAIDSLASLEFKEFEEKIGSTIEKDRLSASLYIKTYLQKAKDLDSISEMAKGYIYMSTFFKDDYEKRIIYLDSGITVVKNSKYVFTAGFFHTHKGAITQKKGDYNKALGYYLEGLKHANKKNVLVYQAILMSNIASIKRILGKYDEAKHLYKKALDYEKKMMAESKKNRDTIRYLIALSDLVSTYISKKEIDSAKYFLESGDRLAEKRDVEGVYTIQNGILQYFRKNYNASINTLEKGIDQFLTSEYRAEYGDYNLINAYFFLGNSYKSINRDTNSLVCFKKIDSMVNESNSLFFASRPAYLELINFYRLKNDKNKQLYFINKLLNNDSIFNNKYKSTSDKLIKEFDTPILISQKEILIDQLQTKNSKSFYIIISSLIAIMIISSILCVSYLKNKRYKRRFIDLMKERNIKNNETIIKNLDYKKPIDISENLVNMILEKLKNYEKNNFFLELNLTSKTVAKKMNTNSKYLGKVIKYYKNKSFTQYVNDQRIDYIVQQLKNNNKLRKYTIKALAKEAGFNSTEAFSKSFYKKTGIYPSFFIKNINNL